MPSTDRFTAPSAWGRYALISGGVALLHGAALWALQTGLVPTAAPTIVPAEVIAEFIAPPAPPRIELPSSNATHLNNPSPGYPAISKRLGEQGRVMLRVLIGADGLPQKVEVSQSSGYERLDRQAQEAVMRWRFVPGKRGGVPEAMWYAQPINFVLE